MIAWWGPSWHAGHDSKVRRRLEAVYLPRFVCSNEKVQVILQKFTGTPPCVSGVRFEWISMWGQPAEIQVWVRCSCAEINEFLRVFLNDDGEIISDTIAPWKLPVAA